MSFQASKEDQPHPERTREIIKKHPEIKKLIGKNPYTFLIILGVVSSQIFLAAWTSSMAWWAPLLVAYFYGAFANHCLYVTIHESAHNLIFKRKVWNKIAGIIADLPNALPTSIAFSRYHLKHHAHQGDYDMDADMANHNEAKLIGNTVIGKAIWLLFFPIFQSLRPPRIKELKLTTKWTRINFAVILVVDFLIFWFFGGQALLYLLASTFFAVGLHPLGARWIQEHYIVSPPQETYSYYGPLNTVALNVGYHNEHHDFPSVPWNKLPKIREYAPEYYNNLVYHTSWTKLLFKFLFDSNLSLYSRVERVDKGKKDNEVKYATK